MKLIAFTGQMGSGKSTAVQHLKDTYLAKKIEVIKFAGPLYELQEFCYRRISSVYKRPENFIKDRKLLQFLGTEWGRGISENLWTDLWKSEVDYVAENYPFAVIVCDDARFDNEAELVKNKGGILIKIESSRTDLRIDTKAGIQNHLSESGVNNKYVDFIVKNDDTMVTFKKTLDGVFKQILK